MRNAVLRQKRESKEIEKFWFLAGKTKKLRSNKSKESKKVKEGKKMAKSKSVFVCNECGATSLRWMGRCPSCGSWNTMVEEKSAESVSPKDKRGAARGGVLMPITEIEEENFSRLQMGMEEFDAVLGGGLVPGSSVLLGGEPGIGKSTLLMQVSALVAQKYGKVLYITGEESAAQVKMRAARLDALAENVCLISETNLDSALQAAEKENFKLLILDSVQAVFCENTESAPGSVSQVRAVAACAVEFARRHNTAVILVGHVTKEGMLAGPRVLEHMVDTVLYFEGERSTSFRILRAVKNRFGSTNEIAVFEMEQKGLLPLSEPSEFFLANRPQNVPGSAVTCVMQGSRPVLLEVQALTAPTSFGNPRRLAAGYDYNRLLIILAVLERKMRLPLASQDVYVNMAGGMKVDDPACDLAVAAAVVSSLKNLEIEKDTVIMGEIGLLGEIRGISQDERRVKEAARFGFNKALLPLSNKKAAKKDSFAAANVEQALLFLGLDSPKNKVL